tara:strand:- start:6793 stop:7140 length:348 start_codon:yes stop_codon:yes gene_type:complete
MKNEDYVKIFEDTACHQVYKMADGVAAVVKAVEEQHQAKRIVSPYQFELGQYYWCKFNGPWLIGQVGFDTMDHINQRENWYLKVVDLIGNSEFKNPLDASLTMFIGGIYKADRPK